MAYHLWYKKDVRKMQIVVVECEVCEKQFETRDNSTYFEETLCPPCYNEWPVIIDCDFENKI